jgi:hypothetical protein
MTVQPTGDTRAQSRYDLAYDRGVFGGMGDGWLWFSVVLLGIVGALNTIDGIAAISNSKFYAHGVQYVFGSLKTWGWIVLCMGVVQLLVAFGITRRNQAARWAGVAALSLNAIAQLMMSRAYPFWSLSIFALDVIAIYGLTAYGQKRPEPAPR